MAALGKLKDKVHKRDLTQLKQVCRNLDADISDKEALMAQLKKATELNLAMHDKYSAKITIMEGELAEAMVKKEEAAAQAAKDSTKPGHQQLLVKNAHKITELQQQLREFRNRLKVKITCAVYFLATTKIPLQLTPL